ncbi:hypothetical protein [Alsobacter sp. R-9]
MTEATRPGNQGFVLLEALVALLLFAVVSAAVFVAVQGGLRGDAEARFRALASVLGRSALEAVEATPPAGSGPAGRLETGDYAVVVTAACGAPIGGLRPCDLLAQVSDRAGRRLDLTTTRLFPAARP